MTKKIVNIRVQKMMMIKRYNQKVKSRLLSQFRKKMLENMFKKCIDIGYQLQKNVRDDIKKSQKNQFFKYN